VDVGGISKCNSLSHETKLAATKKNVSIDIQDITNATTTSYQNTEIYYGPRLKKPWPTNKVLCVTKSWRSLSVFHILHRLCGFARPGAGPSSSLKLTQPLPISKMGRKHQVRVSTSEPIVCIPAHVWGLWRMSGGPPGQARSQHAIPWPGSDPIDGAKAGTCTYLQPTRLTTPCP
jgi:hypothetical protein